ncbi:hypothetical protein N7478_002843 [Penicillium angulare]|uniref:uncharacterized protein n=1 Tax=Penicillium angulare TaxID=116970 RepID=UPI0025421151|nr:uncharacterized protein N7478_002843 [Penicillium angulare]KAJ5287157.1 hypothetical protein N7478_002843 [Penicillium angulare]
MSTFTRPSLQVAQICRGFQPRTHALNCRGFATSNPSQGGSNSRLKLISLVIGIPAVFYLWPRGSKNLKEGHLSKTHGANQEYESAAEGNQQDTSKGPAYDEPRAMGSTKGPNSISFKQQGLSNADTMNPFVNEPGKSQKGEGETETAKVKGTVSPTRPQV